MNVTVFSAHRFEKEYLIDANKAGHDIKFLDSLLNKHTAVLAKDAEAVAVFVNDDVGSVVLEKLHELGVRYILLRSAGYNHVDISKAKALGMKVANVPSYSPYAVAEHTVALMMALNRKIVRAHSRVKEANFSLDGLVGFDMHGKTVGLIGLGKIGEITARILKGFGCELLAVDPTEKPELEEELGIKYVDLDTLCTDSDIISLHAPLNEATKYMISAQQVEKMKNGVMLINTSRGGLIDTKAVIHGLKHKKIGYLGLDVYEEEKGLFFEDHSEDILLDDNIARLMTFPNVLITSHQGFLTKTALSNIANTTFLNLENMRNNDIFENQLV